MDHDKLVFLFGGGDAFEELTDEFLAAAGGQAARIALLLQGGEGWQRYVSFYSEPWLRQGFSAYRAVAPGPDGLLDLDRTQETLQWASGIFVGGGTTPNYHRLYGSAPVSAWIRERWEAGVPYAGLSAGAVLAMEHCVFEAGETADHTVQLAPGLNLVPNLVIGVHFTAQNALPQVIEVMARTRTRWGLGIDDGACVVVGDVGARRERAAGQHATASAGPPRGPELPLRVLGEAVYAIEMQDFERQVYHIARCETAC